MIGGADIIASVLLGLVYLGLTYLGATTTTLQDMIGLDQAPLLIAITNKLLGGYGVIALSVIADKTGSLDFIHSLPLSEYGVAWILPALIAAVIGFFWKDKVWDKFVTEE